MPCVGELPIDVPQHLAQNVMDKIQNRFMQKWHGGYMRIQGPNPAFRFMYLNRCWELQLCPGSHCLRLFHLVSKTSIW